MTRLVDLSLRRRRLVALVWIILALAGGWAASTISDSLSRSFDAPGQPAFDANREIATDFGNGGPIPPIVAVVTVPDGKRISDPTVRRELASAVDGIRKAIPGSRAVSYADGQDPVFVAKDGRTTFALVYPPVGRPSPDENPVALAAARKTASSLEVGGAPVRITGLEALSDDSGGGGPGVGLLAETLLGSLGALIVLAWVFSSLLAFVPLVIAAASILTTFLLLRGLAELTEVSFVVQFLVGLIGLGVAIDYSLLVVFRWREERAAGSSGDDAVRSAMRTAGRAVTISGMTVGIGLLALVVVPVPFIRSIGFGGMLIPIVSVLASLTLLPIILARFGERLDLRHTRKHGGHDDLAPSRAWTRWARGVVHRRWAAAIVGLVVLSLLVLAATSLRPGQPSVDALSSGGEALTALQELERSDIGSGALTPIEVIADSQAGDENARRLAAVPGVLGVAQPEDDAWTRGSRSITTVVPTGDAASDEGRVGLDGVRDLGPDLEGDARVGGDAAQDRDLTDVIYRAFPLMVLLIALITLVLLTRALRSFVLPLKAVLLNVFSVGAAFGVVVLVWQEGYGSELIGGVPATGSITTWVPLAIFAFLYGLSMDYEVFILTRIREEYDRTGSTDEAVIQGLGRTGRLVTSAALILFLAFVAMAAGPNTEIKILATGLAAGIALDATVVRMLVVPALVTLFGEVNWWMPGRLDRLVGGGKDRNG